MEDPLVINVVVQTKKKNTQINKKVDKRKDSQRIEINSPLK